MAVWHRAVPDACNGRAPFSSPAGLRRDLPRAARKWRLAVLRFAAALGVHAVPRVARIDAIEAAWCGVEIQGDLSWQ
jgi:hypothetical protein